MHELGRRAAGPASILGPNQSRTVFGFSLESRAQISLDLSTPSLNDGEVCHA